MASCSKCREEIQADATRCPHCDFAPGEDRRRRGNKLIGWGALISMTIVGAVVGVPMIIGGLWNRHQASGATPADP